MRTIECSMHSKFEQTNKSSGPEIHVQSHDVALEKISEDDQLVVEHHDAVQYLCRVFGMPTVFPFCIPLGVPMPNIRSTSDAA